jgi:hypothetical protein
MDDDETDANDDDENDADDDDNGRRLVAEYDPLRKEPTTFPPNEDCFLPVCHRGHGLLMGANRTFAVKGGGKVTGCSICLEKHIPRHEIAYHCQWLDCYGLQACIQCIKGSPLEKTDTIAHMMRASPSSSSSAGAQKEPSYGVEAELATAFLLRSAPTLKGLVHASSALYATRDDIDRNAAAAKRFLKEAALKKRRGRGDADDEAEMDTSDDERRLPIRDELLLLLRSDVQRDATELSPYSGVRLNLLMARPCLLPPNPDDAPPPEHSPFGEFNKRQGPSGAYNDAIVYILRAIVYSAHCKAYGTDDYIEFLDRKLQPLKNHVAKLNKQRRGAEARDVAVNNRVLVLSNEYKVSFPLQLDVFTRIHLPKSPFLYNPKDVSMRTMRAKEFAKRTPQRAPPSTSLLLSPPLLPPSKAREQAEASPPPSSSYPRNNSRDTNNEDDDDEDDDVFSDYSAEQKEGNYRFKSSSPSPTPPQARSQMTGDHDDNGSEKDAADASPR